MPTPDKNYLQELALATELLPVELPDDVDLAATDINTLLDNGDEVSSLLEFGMNLSERRKPQPPRKPPAAIDANALLAFVVGINPQEREDVLYSLQLASRGASSQFDRFKDSAAWYGKYIEILEQLGWSCTQFVFGKHAQADGDFRPDQTALATLETMITQNQRAVLNQSLEVLKAQAEDSEALRLLDFHATAENDGNFQIGAVEKQEDGNLSMTLGAFLFQSDDRRHPFLFSAWPGQSVECWHAVQTMIFNTRDYARLRDLVEDKLGEASELYIADLEIT